MIEERLIRKRWLAILSKCRCPRGNNSFYKGVTVGNDFMNYDTFRAWYIANYKEGYVIDKDALSKDREHRMYSSSTCAFIPKIINAFFAYDPMVKGYVISNGRYYTVMNKYGRRESFGGFGTPEEAEERYIIEKRNYALELADKYEGRVDSRVIDALRNFDYKDYCKKFRL